MQQTVAPNEISILFYGSVSSQADAVTECIQEGGRAVVVNTAKCVQNVSKQINTYNPDVTVFDTDIDDTNWDEFIQSVRNTHPSLPVLVYLRAAAEPTIQEIMKTTGTDCIQADTGARHAALLANRLLTLVEQRILKQNSTEHSLPQSLGAELAAVSSDFLDINQMPVESQVDTVLRRIGSRVEAERSYVFQIDHEGGTTSNTHEWTAAGVSPEIDNLQNLPLSAIPWWMKKLKQHETITIPDVSGLPAAAEAEQEILEAQNIQSVIVSPMISEGELIGFIGFDWTEKQEVWSEDFVHILRLYAEVIISAIQVERERELQAENERLDRFASVVSHDLRNPLSAAKGWAEAASNVLAENDPDIDLAQTMLTDIADAHQRMDVIITDLLTLARSGQTIEETQSVDITTVAGEAWKTTNTGDSVLEMSVDAGCTVPADHDRLLQIFENLFRNAIEHNDSPVQVTVGLPAEIVNEEDNPSAFFVEDTGCGIPGSQQDAVFDSGETTAAEGTGLGLSIVQSIVDAHGWDITVTDSTDGGARFVITDIDSDRS